MPQPTQFFVPGPALLYAGVGGTLLAKKPLFLGYSIGEVTITVVNAKVPVYNSLGGRTFPMDEIWDGELVMASFIINKFDHDVAERMMSQPNPFGVPGLNETSDIGTLLGSEGMTYPFWVVSPYAFLKAAQFPRLRPGYRFWSATLESPKTTELGNRDKPFHMVVKGMRAFTAAATPTGPAVMPGYAAKFRLYDNDVTGLPNPS